jgi:DNA helicase-2/ATP-dependent DNA helicase PcrA
LQSLLGLASNYTGKQYDVASMFIGTVHSICTELVIEGFMKTERNRPVKTIDQ